jgi:hypothetical protein
MKKIIILFCFALCQQAMAQFHVEYQKGYKDGYCYASYDTNTKMCKEPLKVPYMPNNTGCYDGDCAYMRGKIDGLKAYEGTKNNNTNTRQPYNYGGQVPLDQGGIDAAGNAMSELQRKHDEQKRQQQQQQAQQAEYDRQAKLKAEENGKNKAKALAEQIQSQYISFPSYPKSLSDGWYNVWTTNGYDFTDERKVYVENNLITKYAANDWIYSGRKLFTSYPILNGKTNIKVGFSDTEATYLTVYFLEAISNPYVHTSTPYNSGKVTFYSTCKKCGDIVVKIKNTIDHVPTVEGLRPANNRYPTLTSYFDKDGLPYCGQENGTIIIEGKPGTYNYSAASLDGTWEGTFTITQDGCSTISLNGR